jgi:hypothetical protein
MHFRRFTASRNGVLTVFHELEQKDADKFAFDKFHLVNNEMNKLTNTLSEGSSVSSIPITRKTMRYGLVKTTLEKQRERALMPPPKPRKMRGFKKQERYIMQLARLENDKDKLRENLNMIESNNSIWDAMKGFLFLRAKSSCELSLPHTNIVNSFDVVPPFTEC